LPGAVDEIRIGRCQVGPGDLKVKRRLAQCLIPGFDDLLSGILVARLKAGAFSREAVFAIKLPGRGFSVAPNDSDFS
jgi:hypothetical protein